MAILEVDASTFALWLMDETSQLSGAADEAGNSLGLVRTGVATKVPRYDVDDNGDLCRVGNLASDTFLIGIDAPGAMTLFFINGCTVRFHIRVDAYATGTIFGISAGTGGTEARNQFIVALNSTGRIHVRWEYDASITGPTPVVVSTTPLTIGQWHEVEVTYSPLGAFTYTLDGVADGGGAFPAPPALEPPTHQFMTGGSDTILALFSDYITLAPLQGAINHLQVENSSVVVLDFPMQDAPDAIDSAGRLPLAALSTADVVPTQALTTDPVGTAKSKTFGGSADAILVGPTGANATNAAIATFLQGDWTFDTWVKIFPYPTGANVNGLWYFSATGTSLATNYFGLELVYNSLADGYSVRVQWETGAGGTVRTYTSPVNTIPYALMQTHRAIHLGVINAVTGADCVLEIYVNGVLAATSGVLVNFDGTGSSSTTRLALGIGPTANSELVGSLDEARFSIGARTAQEFLDIYEEGANPITLSDSTAPVIENVVYPEEPYDFFEFDAYDANPGLRVTQVLVELANEAHSDAGGEYFVREAAYDEGAFHGRYRAGGSTVTGAGTQASKHHFRIRPAGGWPVMPDGELHRLIPHLVDQDGNELVIP